MTVSSEISTQAFACDGSTTVFTCPFRVLESSELVGTLITVSTGVSASLVNGTDFTVTGVGGANAIATTTLAYSSAYRINFKRRTARLQQTDYRDNDPFPAESHELALDRLTHMAQDSAADIGRALTVPTPEIGFELPAAAARRGKMMAFNASSGDLEVPGFTASQVAMAIAAAYASGSISTSINVLDYGAVGNGIADDTEAFRLAIAAADATSTKREVLMPAGIYLLSTIYVPIGVSLVGEGHSETLSRTITKLVQATEGDVIRFVADASSGKNYWSGQLRNFAIFGSAAFASGWGIAFRNSAGATVSMQDTSLVSDLSIRNCPSGGIEVPNSGLPIYFQRIKLLFNNGPGIHMTSVTTHQHQGVSFIDISGDANNGGLIKLSGLDAAGSVTIINLKSENRVNATYGGVGMQDNAIVLNGCNGTPITILGGTHVCSVPDGANFKKPGSFIKILDANFPAISWSGVAIRVRPGDTGTDPSVVEYSSTVAVPYRVSSGRFGNSDFAHVTQANGYKQTFGPISSYQAEGPEDTALQVAGTTPAFSLYETDASADAKAWILAASSGEFTLRAINDDGSVGQVIWTATRTSMHIGPDAAGTYLRINGTNTTTATGGAASALPAVPVGYIAVNINGVGAKIPYYS